MRLLLLLAALLAASQVCAQEKEQQELNKLTGAPAGTRCFQSIALAQELARHYVATSMCAQQLKPMDPGKFLSALNALEAIDVDFLGNDCQRQMQLMTQAGQKWIAQDPPRHCAATAAAMRQKPFFKDYVRK